ncbi:uncharacterized protein LOC142353414 isoform X1 [Convolutriloba macropyga]|uniref:uncharacterized protein LOC142353414 isoform X1 n=1 Tax=Convolutriloba macropyga TaxID=536237 RepID=UPI003F521EF3
MNYDLLTAGGSSGNLTKKANSGPLNSDLFSANSDLYTNSTTSNLFQSTNDKDVLFNSSLRTNGTTDKSDLFLRDNGPSLPKGGIYKDQFSRLPGAPRDHLNEVFSASEKSNHSYQRLSDKDVFTSSNGPMNFLNQTNRSINSTAFGSDSPSINSSSATGTFGGSMPPQMGRLSALPQLSQQLQGSPSSRTGGFASSGSVIPGGGGGGGASQFSSQQQSQQSAAASLLSSSAAAASGLPPSGSSSVNRSLYNQHMASNNSTSGGLGGFTSPSRMSPNSNLALHQQASYAFNSAPKRSNSPSVNAFNHAFSSSNVQPSGRSNAHNYGSVSPNLQNSNSLIHLNPSISAPNGRDSSSSSQVVSAIGTSKLDPQDFPALSQKHSNMGLGSILGASNYLSMVSKMSGETSSEFTMQTEDFPALPGSGPSSKSRSVTYQTGSLDGFGSHTSGSGTTTGGAGGDEGSQFLGNQSNSMSYRSSAGDKLDAQSGSLESSSKTGIQTSGDGLVTNIPRGMVTDQFGIVGLLTFIRAAERDSNLVQLALGSDLQNLGLNLSSADLFSTFQSPFAETPCRPQDIDFFVPSEYLTNLHIRERLAPIKLSKYGEDTLFYLFYTNINDVLQLAAAAELYAHDWRYHKTERMWLTRAPGFQAQKYDSYEQGTYLFFDPKLWRKVPKEFRLDYEKLEDKPQLPNANNYHPAHSQVH